MKRRIGFAIGLTLFVIAALWWWRGNRRDPADVSAQESRSRGNNSAGKNRRQVPGSVDGAAIRGRVTDQANAGIAGVVVCAKRPRDASCSVSDSSGQYRIERLPADRFSVSAVKEGYLPEVYRYEGNNYRFTLAVGQTRSGVDFVLERGGVAVTGLVTDLAGTPIDHAQVSIGPEDPRWLRGGPYAIAETDALGTFTSWARPGAAFVEADADGFERARADAWAPGHVTVRLQPSLARISGTAVDAVTGELLLDTLIDVGDRQVSTRNHGTFDVQDLRPGEYRACIAPVDGQGCAEPVRVVLSQHVEGLRIAGTLKPRTKAPVYRVEGKIVVAGPNRSDCPEPAASLIATNHSGDWNPLSLGEDGRLTANKVRPGIYEPEILCIGHIARTYDNVVVTDRDVTGLVWEVDVGSRLTGTVRSHTGQRVANAEIWMIEGPTRQDTLTDRNGMFELNGLAPGTYRFAVVSDAGLSPREGFLVRVPPRGAAVRDVTLSAAGSIAGNVVDDLGQPMAQAQVTVSTDDQPGHGSWTVFDRFRTTSSSSGAFMLPGVRQGRYVLKVTYGNLPLSVTRGAEVTVQSGNVATTTLVVESARGTIAGTVVDASGTPQEGLLVTATREDVDGKSSSNDDMTSSAGAFKLSSLPNGRYTVRARQRRGVDATASHVPAGATIVLRLPPAGSATIAGVVRGLRSPRLHLQIDGGNFDRSKVVDCPDGRFVFDNLPAGDFRLEVRSDDARAVVQVNLRDGQSTPVDIQFRRVTVSGRLMDAFSRAPVPDVRMAIRATPGTDGITDRNGRFVLRDVPPGSIEIMSMSPRMTISERSRSSWVATRHVGETDTDLGDLIIVRSRTNEWDPVGKLGIDVDRDLRITAIDPAGPAAATGLVVGDIITSCDGIDLTGPNSANWRAASRVAPGTRLTLGIARGSVATVVTVP